MPCPDAGAAYYLGVVTQPAPAVALAPFQQLRPQSCPQKLCINAERFWPLLRPCQGGIFKEIFMGLNFFGLPICVFFC
jgi:hypothetical protein